MKIAIPMSNGKTQTYINTAYLDYIADAGYIPVPITAQQMSSLGNVITSMVDGLILPGGIDLDPIYYGEDNYNSFNTDPDKDAMERTLFHWFRVANKPILGICRGFQLIAREFMLAYNKAALMLEFVDHISWHNQTEAQKIERGQKSHFVRCKSAALYAGKDYKKVTDMAVNSMHHQCLVFDSAKEVYNAIKVGKDVFEMFIPLALTGRGLKDEKTKAICEAFEIKNWLAPILAVQWHPEELKDLKLLSFFDRAYDAELLLTKQIDGVV